MLSVWDEIWYWKSQFHKCTNVFRWSFLNVCTCIGTPACENGIPTNCWEFWLIFSRVGCSLTAWCWYVCEPFCSPVTNINHVKLKSLLGLPNITPENFNSLVVEVCWTEFSIFHAVLGRVDVGVNWRQITNCSPKFVELTLHCVCVRIRSIDSVGIVRLVNVAVGN